MRDGVRGLSKHRKTPPGIMFYNDLVPIMRVLDGDQVKKIFIGAFDYSETGAFPDGLNEVASAVWMLLCPKLDRDAENYNDKVLKNRYAAYKRWAEAHGDNILSFDDWIETLESDADSMQTHADAMQTQCDPMPTTTVTPTVTKTVTTTVTKTVEGTGKVGGNGGRETHTLDVVVDKTMPNVSRMTDEEFEQRRQEQIRRLMERPDL